MEENRLITQNELAIEDIKNLIYTIRGKQVMLDSDVAMLYHYTTKNINKAVKRNIDRFPEDFCFQLTEMEFQNLRFQFGTLNKKVNNGEVTRKYLPYVFTEQGISMLSGVLKNEIAVKVSVNIMRAFVEMRKFLMLNGQVFERLTSVEHKLLEHDKKFDEVFNQLQLEENIKQRIFFDGQIYDAYSIIIDIIKKANHKILIIDNYMVAVQLQTKKQILLTIVISNLLFIVSYILLETYIGAVTCGIVAIEIIINTILEGKGKKTPKPLIVLYLIVSILLGIISFGRFIDLLPIIASMLFIFTLIQSKEKYVRLLILGNLASWGIYDFLVKAYLAGISDLFIISSTIIAIIRYDIKKEEKTDEGNKSIKS